MVKLEATRDRRGIKGDGWLCISEDSFEHLLNCLDNQKFIHCINADATTGDCRQTQREIQEAIDDFNRQCRDFWMK